MEDLPVKIYASLYSLILSLLLLLSPSNTPGAELITNGSFETGNFTGWTAVNGAGPWTPWQVVTAGYSTGFNSPAAPQQGTRDALQGVTGSAGSTFTLVQQFTLPAAQTATLTWTHRFQMDNNTFCTGAACGSATYSVEILNTSDVVLTQLYLFTTGPEAIVNTGWQTITRNLSVYAGQTIRLRFRTNVTAALSGPGQLEIDGVSVQSPSLIPTAAGVAVSGRVVTQSGEGLGNAVLYLTGSNGETIVARSNPFGFFTFDDVVVGRTYLLSVSSKRYTFEPMTISVLDEVSNLQIQAVGN